VELVRRGAETLARGDWEGGALLLGARANVAAGVTNAMKRRSEDAVLVIEMQAGDPEAFAEIYDRHSRVAYSIAYRICGPDLAEDATQSAFLAAWRNRAQYKSASGEFRPWLLTIVRNRAIDAYRTNGSERRHRAVLPGSPDDPERGVNELPSPRTTEAEVLGREKAQEVQVGLAKLPAEQREVIELSFFGGRSHSQIAADLELPSGTVKGRMRLGLQKLREELSATR